MPAPVATQVGRIQNRGEIGGKRQCSISQNGVRKYTRTFQVTTSSPLVTSSEIIEAPELPVMFEPYGVFTDEDAPVRDDQALVNEIVAREDPDNPFNWEVDVNYSSDCTDPGQGEEGPIGREPLYKWTNETVKEALERDLDNKWILNAAGMAFDPPPEADIAHRVLTITRNERTFDPVYLDRFSFATNQNTFFGYPAGQARMEPIEVEESFEGAEQFWKVIYVIKFRKLPRTWNLRALNQGSCVLDDGDALVVATDKNGAPVNGMVLLNEIGRQITTNPPVPVYFNFRAYSVVDFDELLLAGP